MGIEEQRVNVKADLREASPSLGDGYRVTGRIIIWEAEDVLQVPVSALFRRGEGWSLFVVENNRACLREVEIGQRTPFEAEIKRLPRTVIHTSHPTYGYLIRFVGKKLYGHLSSWSFRCGQRALT